MEAGLEADRREHLLGVGRDGERVDALVPRIEGGKSAQRGAAGRRSACAAPTATSALPSATASTRRTPLTTRTVPALRRGRYPSTGRASGPSRRTGGYLARIPSMKA